MTDAAAAQGQIRDDVPEIQERVLDLKAIDGRESMTERGSGRSCGTKAGQNRGAHG
jgi:hypothetical protein